MEKLIHLPFDERTEAAYSDFENTLECEDDLQEQDRVLRENIKSLKWKLYLVNRSQKHMKQKSKLITVELAQASCRNLMMRLERKFPREIRDMVYHALLDTNTIEYLKSFGGMVHIFNSHSSQGERGRHKVLRTGMKTPHYLDPSYVGQEVATEIAETALRIMFSTKPARIGENFTKLLTMDPFNLGVTPGRFLQEVQVDWDPKRIFTAPKEFPTRSVPHWEKEREGCLAAFEWDLTALQHLEPRSGLSLTILLHRDYDFTIGGSWVLYEEMRKVLDKFKTTHEYLTRSRITYRIVVDTMRAYQGFDLTPYYTMGSPDEAWEYLSTDYAEKNCTTRTSNRIDGNEAEDYEEMDSDF